MGFCCEPLTLHVMTKVFFKGQYDSSSLFPQEIQMLPGLVVRAAKQISP